jgi:hypothetical protein
MGPIFRSCSEYPMADHDDRALKAEAVQLALTQHKTGASVARARGISSKTGPGWVIADPTRPGETLWRQLGVSGKRPSPARWAATHSRPRRGQCDRTNSAALRHPRLAVIVPFMPAHRVPCAIMTQGPIRDVSRSDSEAWCHRLPSIRAGPSELNRFERC